MEEVFIIEPKLDDDLLKQNIIEIDEKLRGGFITHKIPINYLLLEEIKIHYTNWIVKHREYMNVIKLTFCQRDKEEEIVINPESREFFNGKR